MGKECYGENWFSEDLIIFCFKNLRYRCSYSKKNIISLTPAFMAQLQVTNWADAVQTSRNYEQKDWNDADSVVIPIFHSRHWLCAVIKVKERQVIVCDSVNAYGDLFLNVLKNFETDIASQFSTGSQKWDFKNISEKVPYQTDNSSCGPLSLLNSEYIIKNLDFDYNIEEIITTLRFNISMAILTQYKTFL